MGIIIYTYKKKLIITIISLYNVKGTQGVKFW